MNVKPFLWSLIAVGLWFVLPTPTFSQIATSPSFTLEKSVVATGGGASSSSTFSLEGTAGQDTVERSTSLTFQLESGFWTSDFSPTAAEVSITGKVTTANGNGIRNVLLTLMGPGGTIRRATTSAFGYYAFDGVEVGHTYVLEATSKRYTFTSPTRVFNLQDTQTNMDFTAMPN